MNTREKLAVYLAGQFVAVAALAAVVASMLGRFPFGDPRVRPVATTLPAWVAMRTVEAVGLAFLLAYPAALVAVLVYGRSLEDRTRYWSAVGITALSLPVLALVVASGFLVGFHVGRLVAATLGVLRDDGDEHTPNGDGSPTGFGGTVTPTLTPRIRRR
jgi:MFS family permease